MQLPLKSATAAFLLLASYGCTNAPVDARTHYAHESRKVTPTPKKHDTASSPAPRPSKMPPPSQAKQPPIDDVKLEGENVKLEGN